MRLGTQSCIFSFASFSRVRALPIDAFFLDAQSYLGTPSGLTTSMARMTAMMGISAGPTGALAPACVDAHQHAPHLCLLPPVLQEFVRTPFFLLQTTFDQWQLANVLGLPWSNCIVSNHRAEYVRMCFLHFNIIMLFSLLLPLILLPNLSLSHANVTTQVQQDAVLGARAARHCFWQDPTGHSRSDFEDCCQSRHRRLCNVVHLPLPLRLRQPDTSPGWAYRRGAF